LIAAQHYAKANGKTSSIAQFISIKHGVKVGLRGELSAIIKPKFINKPKLIKSNKKWKQLLTCYINSAVRNLRKIPNKYC